MTATQPELSAENGTPSVHPERVGQNSVREAPPFIPSGVEGRRMALATRERPSVHPERSRRTDLVSEIQLLSSCVSSLDSARDERGPSGSILANPLSEVEGRTASPLRSDGPSVHPEPSRGTDEPTDRSGRQSTRRPRPRPSFDWAQDERRGSRSQVKLRPSKDRAQNRSVLAVGC